MRPEERIRSWARDAGFDQVGFASTAVGHRPGARLRAFLEAGYHGSMAWLEDRATQRASPQALWPEARSVIMLAMNYGPDVDPMVTLEERGKATISVYARNRDYHDLVKKRLKQVARQIHQDLEAPVKVFVDTAPVMEKPLAERAGLGWQGKHTNLVSRQLGSWAFLGAIYTTLDLAADVPHDDHCGACRRCLDICPTDAFPAPYQLDARRCISYLTIEHKGHIPVEFRKPMGNRIYGCDDCLAVCPWNKFARTAREAALQARGDLRAPALRDLVGLNDPDFRTLFSGSPIKRIGRDRFVRNVLIAMANSDDPSLLDDVAALLNDPSPLVRAMAVWCHRCLLPDDDFVALKAHKMTEETDPDVRAEWAR